MAIVLNGATSGNVTIDANAISGTSVITLPVGSGTFPLMTLSTAVATTSGTSINFTDIPSWAKKITVMFNGVSTNGTSPVQIQLGTGGTPTYTTSGYLSYVVYNGGASSSTTGLVTMGIGSGDTRSGQMILSTSGSNAWSENCGYAVGTNGGAGGGGITLAAALTAVRITTVNGTDTFDAGLVNILMEGY
jgi:hypothetical protein